MNTHTHLPVALGAMLLCAPIWAQAADAPAAPAEQAATPDRAPSLPTDPQIVTGKLDNGLTYIIRPTREPAGRASVRLYVGVGSLHEDEHNSGISHFLEHMVFNGSRTFKRGELIPTMQKLGLGFGGDANAYTSLLHTVYMLDLPNLEEKTVDFAMTIMRDFADGATLEADAIDHERGIVVSELKSRDSAGYRAMIQVMEQLTEGTRVAHFLPIGRESVIRDAAYDVVRDYYRDHYVPGVMTVMVTGDFAPEQALAWIKKHFDTMEARAPKPAPPLGELRVGNTGERLIPNAESADCTFMATVVKPYVFREDTAEQRIKDFPLDLAISMLNRRLNRKAKQPDCPFIAASVGVEEMFRANETISISLTATPENWQKALNSVMLELRRAMQYGFADSEINEIKSVLLSNLRQACATWETVPAQAMASRLVDAVSNKRAMPAPEAELALAEHQLAAVEAPRAQGVDVCRKALEEAFDLTEARLTLTGSLPEGVDGAALRRAYEATLAVNVPPPTVVAAPAFAYETIGMPGVVMQQSYLEDLGVTQLTLSNGVKVNLKPIDFRKGSISVSAAVDGGSMSLPDAPGLSNMVNAVMARGGLREHNMDELEHIFAGKHVGLDFNLGLTRYFFSGNTDSEDFELQCKLLAAAILHPGFHTEGERMLRQRLDSQYREFTTKPEGALAMQMRQALFGDNPRFTIPAQEQIEARNTKDVENLLSTPLQTNAIEVTIVGDFKVEDVVPAIERTFGAMPQRSSEFTRLPDRLRHVEFRPWGQRAFLRYPTDLDKTIVAHVRPAGNGRDLRRNRRLQVLASIVREKLFDGLRAVMGESYSPRVQVVTNSEYDNAAYIVASSAGVKGNRTRVSAAMESICNGIGQGQISREDFDCAVLPFRAQVRKQLVTPSYWEENLATLQSEPSRVALMRDFVEDADSISYEEICELAREVFGRDNANFYFVVPEDYDENEDSLPASSSAIPQADLTSLNSPAPGEYAVVISRETLAQPQWAMVAQTLSQKYPNSPIIALEQMGREQIAQSLRAAGARYAAFVLRPEEVTRQLVNNLHRATRELDDDPYGDCIWGIVTGYTPDDAMRIAKASEPLVVQRVLSTTNVDASRFEHSYCITDWEGFPILEQTGYTSPVKTTFSMNTPEGQDAIENGVQGRFAYQLSTQKPQFIVTSSHATPFNLEMPFSKGLIFSANNRFYQMGCKQLASFASALQPAMGGKPGALSSLAEAMQFPAIEPDSTDRVWLAAGNCLIGDARGTTQSMVITAISAYRCNQFVGYTVPSWYGEAGWGTLALFMGNTDNTTLAEAFFLNNQFIIEKTRRIDERLLGVHFNEPELGPALQRDLISSGVDIKSKQARDAVGLVHDRDTLAFYGDPGWAALVDHSHAHAPLRISWQDDSACTLTANTDYTGRVAIWFPKASIGRGATGCNINNALTTNDFILIPNISLKAGESLRIEIRKAQPEQADEAA